MIFTKIFTKKSHHCRHYSKIRVRFAPSPTGFLHLGGLRTALYNYLFAKANKGKFILRIEDTDQTRLVDGAIDQLHRDLTWAGLEINEGPADGGDYGPYIQSQRLHIYREHVEKLLQNGTAYHCFCTDKRLELLRREALRAREIPKYDNRCRNLTRKEAEDRLARHQQACIRFKLKPGPETFHDLIYGSITYDVATNEGDPVIIKSDGYPTYHFANVVDDHCMQISHVLRGVEWQISTTKHLLMYRAFGWESPKFGHLPLLMNPDGTKLSKRQGDIKISHYRDSGVFPLAVVNFIATSGGGFEKDSERHLKPHCYTLEELTEQFDISRINSHSGKLMPERLLEFNRLELKRKLQDEIEETKLIQQLVDLIRASFPGTDALEVERSHVRNILKWAVDRITKLPDLVATDLKFIWVAPKDYKVNEEQSAQVERLIESLGACNSLERDKLNAFLKQFCEENHIKFSHFMRMLRSILSGLKEGPSVAEMIEILGKDTTLKRLRVCIATDKK